MEPETFYFWSFCLFSLFLGRAISHCLFPEPAKFLEAYGGCDCDDKDCKKIDVIESRGKKYRRIIQVTYIPPRKMPYRYSKIYNVTQGLWAHNVAGEDDPQQIWEDNEWDENDALVGFYSDGESDFHNVIFCRPGYAVYVQAEEDKERAEFNFDETKYRVPPAMLVNLNDAYDGGFMYNKSYPYDSDTSDSDTSDSYSVTSAENRAYTHIPENQRVIDFLYRCRSATNNQYKKKAYDNAINEIHNYCSVIDSSPSWEPCIIGESIARKIREFMDGFPEDDIINS